MALLAGASSPVAAAPWAPLPWEVGESQAEDITLTLVTFGPGDQIVSMFGHSALIVEDRRLRRSRLYNYGYFAFDRAMILRYAFGELLFSVGGAGAAYELANYAGQNRDVRLVELDLEPAAALRTAERLAEAVKPENKHYLYEHYTDNCATRIRDLIDDAIGGGLTADAPGRMTLREHTRRYAHASVPLAFFFDYLLGRAVDAPLLRAGEAFLPDELEAQVLKTVLPAVPMTGAAMETGLPARRLARSSVVLFVADRAPPPAHPPSYVPGAMILSGLLSLAALWLSWRRHVRALAALSLAVSVPFGIAGVLLVVLATVTRHTFPEDNDNLLLGPSFALAVPPLIAAWRGHPAARFVAPVFMVSAALALIGLGLKVLPQAQHNHAALALVLPVSVALAVAWHELRRA